MPTEQLIIEIEKPEPEKEVLVKPAETKPEPKTDPKVEAKPEPEKSDDGGALAQLKAQFGALQAKEAEGRRAREAAERDAERFRDEAGKASQQVADSEYAIIVNGIEAAKAESESASNELASAFETGDKSKHTAASIKLMDARAKLLALNEGKSAIETRAQAAREAEKNRPAQPERKVETGDQFEDYLGNTRYSDRTKQWLRQHRECVTDQRASNRAYAAHYEATADGITPDTDAYFDYLDQKLGFKGGAEAGKQARAAPAAPVSRDENVSNGRLTGDKVRLTSREVQAAEDLGLTTAEYARRKLLMTKEGYYRNIE